MVVVVVLVCSSGGGGVGGGSVGGGGWRFKAIPERTPDPKIATQRPEPDLKPHNQ